MKQSVTQELDYGCGVACFAYACNMTFKQAQKFLGVTYSVKHGWRPSDLVSQLNRYGFKYKNHYVRKKLDAVCPIGTIVLIERSPSYPVGHYLILGKAGWMDPWINLPISNNLSLAESGFRAKLPGKAMYALTPES
ncbi:MAG TPA: hypothetical protein VF575_02390 [Candidatus Saccharimonadales bacterium]|jgi:hypothetical protein